MVGIKSASGRLFYASNVFSWWHFAGLGFLTYRRNNQAGAGAA